MFHKFPSTPYIEIDPIVARTDKVLTMEESRHLFNNRVTIEEKIDGANLGISFESDGNMILQNRGSYILEPFVGQWKPLEQWLRIHQSDIFDVLLDRYILFGEWCYVKHSIYYSCLPDWFIGFDIFDKHEGKFLSVCNRNQFFNEMMITPVPILGTGIYTINDMTQFFRNTKFGEGLSEGIYIRQDEGDYLKTRAKIVRKEFRQCITEHWTKQTMVYNKVRETLINSTFLL